MGLINTRGPVLGPRSPNLRIIWTQLGASSSELNWTEIGKVWNSAIFFNFAILERLAIAGLRCHSPKPHPAHHDGCTDTAYHSQDITLNFHLSNDKLSYNYRIINVLWNNWLSHSWKLPSLIKFRSPNCCGNNFLLIMIHHFVNPNR